MYRHLGFNKIVLLISDGMRYASDRDPALAKEKPDRTFYLAMDVWVPPNPHYHNEKFYSYDAMKILTRQQMTPQINHISLKAT